MWLYFNIISETRDLSNSENLAEAIGKTKLLMTIVNGFHLLTISAGARVAL